MKSHTIKVLSLVAVFAVILALSLFWFLSGGEPLEAEAPFRFVIGGLFIFLLPGMLLGELLGFRSDHFLETIALSFALTLTVELIILPVPFLLHATIKLWILLLFAISFLAICVLVFKVKNSKETEFLNPIVRIFQENKPLNITTPLLVLSLIVVSFGAYRWGENITDIDGEKLLHLTFIRYYFTMPLVLGDLALTKGAIPPNLVHLWEYLLAGWSSLINVDPLFLFYRARFVIPLLSFSGMYLLIRNIFSNREKAEVIIWGVLIMCLGWFALLSPSTLDWIKQDPFRGIMSSMGTVHHADAAMEILVPLISGLVLLAFRKAEWRSFLLLAGVLATSFMWHVREFFQAAVYLGIFGLTLVFIPNIDRKKMFVRFGFIASIFIIIVIFFSTVIYLKVPKTPHSYDELKLKEIALSYAIQNITDIRTLFHFPVDLRLTQGLDKSTLVTNEQISYLVKNSWNFFLWLIISAFAVPFLVAKGSKEDKHLSIFYILLWFLVLCWGFSQMLLIVLTYSEINFTTPRMIYIFSYIIIALAIYTIFKLIVSVNLKRVIIGMIALLIAGFIFKLWWSAGLPLAKTLSTVMTVIFVVSFIMLIYPKTYDVEKSSNSYILTSILGIFVFLIPVLAKEYIGVASKIITGSRPPVEWFNRDNPFGFSGDLLKVMRSLPPKQIFLVNPFSKTAASVYAPQYYAVVPEFMGVTLVGNRDIYDEFRQGKNPLFKRDTTPINAAFIKKTPDFSFDFTNWRGAATVKNDIANAAPPMVLHSYTGNFIFSHISTKDGHAIHVSPSPDVQTGPIGISFGYAHNDNGLHLNFRSGQEIVFAADIRLSKRANNAPQAFITDIAGGRVEVSNTPINEIVWKEYTVRKRIMDASSTLSLGILWHPENRESWLEMKNVRIYIADSMDKYYQAPKGYDAGIQVNHEEVKDWLNKHHVDYLLIENSFYTKLLPYFNRFPMDYKIVFNNKQDGELIVRYQRKSA